MTQKKHKAQKYSKIHIFLIDLKYLYYYYLVRYQIKKHTLMNYETAKEILDTMPKEKTRFFYFRDKYALILLQSFIGEGMFVKDIKKTPLKKLLEKKVIKNIIAKIPDGFLTQEHLAYGWEETPLPFVVTLGLWGIQEDDKYWSRWYNQMARKGTNLVLQLNFTNLHNKDYKRFLNTDNLDLFEFHGHPINKQGYHTLAWSRIDLDIENNEALIEEIQNDWVRNAYEDHMHYTNDDGYKSYIEDTLRPYEKIWEEAILAATIWFLLNEIGINTIYYYTYETGNIFKGLINQDSKPPKSLYTKIPKKFCFSLTENIPQFIKNARARENKKILQKHSDLLFYKIEFPTNRIKEKHIKELS